MGKRILGVIAFAAIAAVAGWNYQQNKQEVELTDLALENVEALASGEWHSHCSWRTGHSSLTGWIAICDHWGVGYECSIANDY